LRKAYNENRRKDKGRQQSDGHEERKQPAETNVLKEGIDKPIPKKMMKLMTPNFLTLYLFAYHRKTAQEKVNIGLTSERISMLSGMDSRILKW